MIKALKFTFQNILNTLKKLDCGANGNNQKFTLEFSFWN